jgi:hypothetical protein
MFRLIGFLVGSVASIVVILLVIGMPNFELGDRQADQRRFDEAIEMLKAKQTEFENVADRLSEDVARVAETVEKDVADAVPPAAETPPDLADADETSPPAGLPVATNSPVPAVPTTMWYSFWNPFRSEIAANGFVSQLERVTGMDYRVVKVRTGVYEVAFPYRDEEERRSKVSRIAAATGLDLPES